MPAKRVSQAAVLDAACRLFAEHGYEATSMNDIADALGVRAPSLYNHVGSKQEILHRIMDSTMDRALEALDAALDGTEEHSDQLRRAIESLVLEFLRHPNEVTVSNSEVRSLEPEHRDAIIARRDAYASRVRKIINAGCRAGSFRTDSPQLAAYAVLELGNAAKSWFRPDGEFGADDVARVYGQFALDIVQCAKPSINSRAGSGSPR